jgi:hypothetical protein
VHIGVGAALITYGTGILAGDVYLLAYGPQTAGAGLVSVLLTTLAGASLFGGFVKLGIRFGNIFRM